MLGRGSRNGVGSRGEGGHGGAESNMLGWELQRKKRQNLGQKKERERVITYIIFSQHFYSSRASKLLHTSKASKKTANEDDSPAWGDTDHPFSPK